MRRHMENYAFEIVETARLIRREANKRAAGKSSLQAARIFMEVLADFIAPKDREDFAVAEETLRTTPFGRLGKARH